jgi:GTP:adenosylcobinamide-phosphate guanylyltransferase
MKIRLLKKIRKRYKIYLVESIGDKFLKDPYFKLIDLEDDFLMYMHRDLGFLNDKLIEWVKKAYPKAIKRKRKRNNNGDTIR